MNNERLPSIPLSASLKTLFEREKRKTIKENKRR